MWSILQDNGNDSADPESLLHKMKMQTNKAEARIVVVLGNWQRVQVLSRCIHCMLKLSDHNRASFQSGSWQALHSN